MTEKKQGKKISQEEAKGLDRSKMGVGLSGKEPTPEVEGQYLRAAYGDCPWCGAYLRVVDDTNWVDWYTCGACGGSFRF